MRLPDISLLSLAPKYHDPLVVRVARSSHLVTSQLAHLGTRSHNFNLTTLLCKLKTTPTENANQAIEITYRLMVFLMSRISNLFLFSAVLEKEQVTTVIGITFFVLLQLTLYSRCLMSGGANQDMGIGALA